MEDPTGAETPTYPIMTINMNGKSHGPGTSEKRRKLIVSTIKRFPASVIFCQETPNKFEREVVERCGNDGSSYKFVPNDIHMGYRKTKVAVMWRETDFESKEVDLTEPSITKIVKTLEKEMSAEDVTSVVRVSMGRSAMVKLTSRGTTKASFLAVSWCGPFREDKLGKLKVFHDLICFVREVCKNEKLSWFIIGGGFNFDLRKVDLTKHGLETIPHELCTRDKEQRGYSFVPYKDTFIFSAPSDKLPITVSKVEPLEIENGSSKNPLLDYVPVVGVLNLGQDKDTFTEDTSKSHASDKTTNKKDTQGLTPETTTGTLESCLRASGTLRKLFEDVPPEILARGPLALEAYKNALTEGKTHVKRVPVMLIGQERTGKTSLQKSLKGKPFEPDEGSTVGIDVDPSHFKLSTEIWKLGEKDPVTNSGTTISYEHHVARLTVKNLRQNKGTPAKNLSESLKSGINPIPVSSDFLSESSASNVPSDHESLMEVHNSDCTLGASTAAVPGTNSDDSATFHDFSNDTNQTSRDPQNIDFIPDMSEDTATLVEMFLKEDNKVEEEEEEEEEIYSVLWDFAGQSVYYTTHSVFLTPRAIYLLVNNLSQNPHEKAKAVVKRGIFRRLEDTFNVKTNLDYLDLWMSSIASLAIQGESREVNTQSEVLPEKLPPVFLVCTHADKPYDGGDPYELAQDVFGSLRSKPHKSHLYDNVFVVDNTKSGHEVQCPEVARLRKEVLDVAKELPHLKEPIPIKWLRYEKALKVRREDGDNWIPLDSARQIASEECNITDEKQFRTLLDFLHDQRILIHFSDTPKLDSLVVLDPQWLIGVFKKVITIKPYDRKEKEFEQLWCKLEERGILEEKLLKHVWDTLFDNEKTIESLIEIMEKFSLLCLWSSSDVTFGKQYLVPSMLMSHPPEGIMQLIASAQVPPLFLRFESGQVPLGLFPRLVLQFFQWSKEKYMSTVDPQLYHNFARFYTSKNSSVILLCHSSSIEVVVHEGSPTLELAESLQTELSLSENVSNDTFVVSCAHEVRRQLGLLLESMRNEFCWLKSMKYEESFLCPICCQGREIYYCRKHCARGCKKEECLHFWSESELRNVEKNLCTKSAVAEGPTVQVEQFAPWLAAVGNQLTPGESDGRSIISVEGSKEIAIPDQVLKGLLSQSCDANEIVLQLRETIKVENASLEQPDSETKTLIRCLARKAKESNRLDVFQHLREITPAGCTGPLLPDLLDIRNIPVSKARELTIDLSGGHEWQVVAEGLGLTPLEIRFLDSRTLNPFDAALSFIARQRHITVGNLYDLLNELGFPVIADRRL